MKELYILLGLYGLSECPKRLRNVSPQQTLKDPLRAVVVELTVNQDQGHICRRIGHCRSSNRAKLSTENVHQLSVLLCPHRCSSQASRIYLLEYIGVSFKWNPAHNDRVALRRKNGETLLRDISNSRGPGTA